MKKVKGETAYKKRHRNRSMNLGKLSWCGFIALISSYSIVSCKKFEQNHTSDRNQSESAQVDGESEGDIESEELAETPEMHSAQVLLSWSGSEQLAWCDSETEEDPYCDEEWHTVWQPAEGLGYFQNKDHVYSRVRSTWALSDSLWAYLIETKPAGYLGNANGPLYVMAFLKPPSTEANEFLRLGLKGANGEGPDSVSIVHDKNGESYLRSTWKEKDLGVESSFLEYQSLSNASLKHRIKISENNHESCDSITTPCYAFSYAVQGDGAILSDTLWLRGSGILPDQDNLIQTIGDTVWIIVDRSDSQLEKIQCPEYLSRDSVLLPGSRLFGKLVAEPKMLIGGGLVEHLPEDSLNPHFKTVRLKSSDLYPGGTLDQGSFAANQHNGMFLHCGYWWQDDARRKAGTYSDSAWMVTYFVPLPDARTIHCSFEYRFTKKPERAYCELL